jgi:hypothetical protein
LPNAAASTILRRSAGAPATDDRDMMARKPNYRFERQERERLKAEKKAEKAARKAAEEQAQQEGSSEADKEETKSE